MGSPEFIIYAQMQIHMSIKLGNMILLMKQLIQEYSISCFIPYYILKLVPMPHHWNKLLVEEELIKSGLQYTILQPAIYMQNVLPQIERTLKIKEIELPYNP